MNKLDALKEYLQSLGSVAVAFSGGVDSTFLLKVAHDTLGDQAIAITATSESFPERELNEAKAFTKKEGIRHIIIASDELNIPGFRENPKNRCYLCKHELFTELLQTAKEQNIAYVAEGSNMDDNGDYRPGLQAIAELHILSPLRHVELYKKEIREYSKQLGLPTWDKQSFACLASRFVYGETIDEKKLHMVDQAENLLLELGFKQVRVRMHEMLARIEVGPQEVSRFFDDELREKVYTALTLYGFKYVTIDLKGYTMGSMNKTLPKE